MILWKGEKLILSMPKHMSSSPDNRNLSPSASVENPWVSLRWKPGYFHKRPLSVLKNVQSSARRIEDAHMGLFPGTNLQADILTVTENYSLHRKTRVLRILTPRTFPRIALNRFANDTLQYDTEDDLVSLPSSYRLEGDFHSYFDIRYVRGTERMSLEVLTPDVMQVLTELPQNIDVELSEGSIFVYFRAGAASLEDTYSVQALIAVGHLLIKELVDKGHPATVFSNELKTHIAAVYTVSGSKMVRYYILEIIKSSVVYWLAAGWIFMLIVGRVSDVLLPGYLTLSLLGFGLLLFSLGKRHAHKRNAR